MVRHADMYKKI